MHQMEISLTASGMVDVGAEEERKKGKRGRDEGAGRNVRGHAHGGGGVVVQVEGGWGGGGVCFSLRHWHHQQTCADLQAGFSLRSQVSGQWTPVCVCVCVCVCEFEKERSVVRVNI